ncbi:hypothetical protein AAFF_G00426010 [Aldrovandia affinis]|uniref:Uncharacterized protein n=1 Tax=Aldrovandia affinis TaxID=143900 RepID=A0AAD7T739_9TELE|nr:hypothetical protein AAFF_G00426010 [Aldrovandia affinis]
MVSLSTAMDNRLAEGGNEACESSTSWESALPWILNGNSPNTSSSTNQQRSLLGQADSQPRPVFSRQAAGGVVSNHHTDQYASVKDIFQSSWQ